MIEKKLLETIDKLCRAFSSTDSHKPFGGKSIILIGDPAQLPSIGPTLFLSHIWNLFSVSFLRQVKLENSYKY